MEASFGENFPREVEPSLVGLSETIVCPITQMLMQDPVVAADTHSYERAAIEQWIAQRGARAVSPMTGGRLAHLELIPNTTLRVVIESYRSSLPQRQLKELSQQDLALAIKLREEELSNQLVKQHKQLEQLSSVQERLGPMEEENQRLRKEIERLNSKPTIQRTNDNNNNNYNVISPVVVKTSSDSTVEKHASDIVLLTQQLSELNEAHSANMIKRLLFTRISRKKLNQTRLVREEENSLHGLEILQQEYQQRQAELQRQLQASLQKLESDLKSNLTEIGKKISEHAGEEGDDEVLEKLTTQRKQVRQTHEILKGQTIVVHATGQKIEEEKQALKAQEQKTRLQQIKASKASKQRELNRWSTYTRNYTGVIESQRQQLTDISKTRSERAEQLVIYTKETERDPLKLMIARRQREERLLIPSTSSQRVNQKAQSVSGRVTREEITELLNYTVRDQIDKVRECLSRNKDLVYGQGNVTDLSDRNFPNITGFQYAIWAGSEDMWELYLTFMPQSEAYDQLMALKNERLDITGPDGVGAPLSFFDGLINAYQIYVDNYEPWSAKQCGTHWCKEVGGAQRNMPAWFIYVFSEEGEDKAWPKQEMTRAFSRDLKHLTEWFTAEYDGGKCGSSFAFLRRSMAARGQCGRVGIGWGAAYAEAWGRIGLGELRHDLVNAATLKTECTKKLAVLTERLSQPAKSASSISLLGLRK